MKYFAHTAVNAVGKPLDKEAWQYLHDHLRGVSERAGKFARPCRMEEEAVLAGLLHDLGKYAVRFQARLCNPTVIHGINHWAAGAACALERRLWSVAFAVDGHHTGIPSWGTPELPGTQPLQPLLSKFSNDVARKKVTGDCTESLEELRGRFQLDGLPLPEVTARPGPDNFAEALRTRFLLSCLVDADRLDTAEHAEPGQEARRKAPGLEAEHALEILQDVLKEKSKKATASRVNPLRVQLLADCLAAAETPPGLFTLTAPTGSGKTLASLAFALRHIVLHNARLATDDPRRLRRVIVVVPFTSIIEQTARIFRDVFEGKFGPDYILEHHSAVAPRERADDAARNAEDARLQRAQQAAENWASPVVVTTSVQFFESLFAHRPSDCRKLHSIARTVVLFDEVQTLPPRLAPSLLSAVSLLTQEPYGVTAVFMTATQPAFDRVAPKLLPAAYRWNPTEISSDPEAMARMVRLTRFILPKQDELVTWKDLAAKLAVQPQVLCVVNTTKDARELFRLLPAEGRYHLSARMCPAHRQKKLEFVRQGLMAKDPIRPVRLISTQLIEAGVDVDFPVAFRAYGPLDSIIQTAGRCNREGSNLEQCPVTVFHPAEGSRLPEGYEQVMDLTKKFLDGTDPQTLHLPETYRQYFEQLYLVAGHDKPQDDLAFTYSSERDFPAAAEACQLIPKGTRSVLTEWEGGDGKMLAAKLKEKQWLTRDECRRVQRLSVNLYEWEFQEALARGVINQPAPKWNLYVWKSQYDEDWGVCHAEGSDCVC